jgi:hypothetical protein
MSRTPLGTTRESLVRADNDTPDPGNRSRKKARWNSNGLVDGHEQGGDSEESTYDDKVGPRSSSIHLRRSLSFDHTHALPHRPARRFV